MISNLPRDLAEEILSRIPLKSMRAVRLTCKKWNTLSKRRSFSKVHLGKEVAATRDGESQMIVFRDFNLYLMSVVVNDDPFIELKGKFTCLDEQVKITQVFYCEGLLLCILEDTRVVVWNPYSGQTRWIEIRCSQRPHGTEYYALGYVNKNNNSRRSHVLLRHISRSRYEIYDFDSDLWTTLDVTPDWYILGYGGVSLKGNTYYCATKENLDEQLDELENHIICFDFTRERFGPLLPLPIISGNYDYVTLSCVKEEKLAVLIQHNMMIRYECDVWITTKIEAEKILWSKFLTVDLEHKFQMTIPQSFFIDEEKKVVMSFDQKLHITGEAEYYRILDLKLEEPANKIHRSPHVYSYVPSFVQIKQPSGGRKKRHRNSISKA